MANVARGEEAANGVGVLPVLEPSAVSTLAHSAGVADATDAAVKKLREPRLKKELAAETDHQAVVGAREAKSRKPAAVLRESPMLDPGVHGACAAVPRANDPRCVEEQHSSRVAQRIARCSLLVVL